MGTKEKLIIRLAIKIMKKIKLMKALERIADKTDNEIDDLLVGFLSLGLQLVDQYYVQGKELEDLEIE